MRNSGTREEPDVDVLDEASTMSGKAASPYSARVGRVNEYLGVVLVGLCRIWILEGVVPGREGC